MLNFCSLGHDTHELPDNLGALDEDWTPAHESCGHIRKPEVGPVDQNWESGRYRSSIGRRRQGGGVQVSGNQRRHRFEGSPSLNELYVPGIHARLPQHLDGEVMRVAADTVDADFFALEVLYLFDLWLGQQAMGQEILDAADKDEIRGPLHVGTDDSLAASQGDLCIASQHRRSHRGG